MAADDFSVTMPPVEDLCGGGSRTRHVVLKRRHASLSQSAFSCAIGRKIAPNRDYPYEGLHVLLGGDSWKFIDVIALGVRTGDEWLGLEPVLVRASPWESEYSYRAGELSIKATYYLYDAPGGAGVVDVELRGKKPGEATIVLEPFFDIRFMYDPSAPDEHRASSTAGALTVSVGDRAACLTAADARFVRRGRQVRWVYKLGSGDRHWQDDRPGFVADERVVSSFYDIEVDGPRAALRFACGATRSAASRLAGGRYPRGDEARASTIRGALFPAGAPVNREVLFRAIGMDHFGMCVDGVLFREAGDFWFRSVWFRDEFEGLMQNYRAIKAIDGIDEMKHALLKSFDLQDDGGRIPNRLVPGAGGRADYNSADATLLAFMLGGRVLRDSGDRELAHGAAAAFRKYLDGVRRGGLEANGPPCLRPNGLISVPPWHSWTDGMREIDGLRLPIRVSEAWERELISRNASGDLSLQKFFLPEICAQWMRALGAGALFNRYDGDFAVADTCEMLFERARASFKPLFLDPGTGYIRNLVTTDDFALGRRADPTPGSPGVVAAAILGRDVFTRGELEGVATFARSRLLRTKWGMPFGVVVRDSGRGVYLGEAEYHEAVVWPRDTPYLIRLLRLTGDLATVDGLLSSNLRHQMEEGFVFYNQELFSGDDDLVPVKDPVQWWSQWVDPYLERRNPGPATDGNVL